MRRQILAAAILELRQFVSSDRTEASVGIQTCIISGADQNYLWDIAQWYSAGRVIGSFHYFFKQQYCPVGISHMGNSGCFPRGKPAATESRYQTYVRFMLNVLVFP